jgi:hypothetical protein
MTLPMPLQTVFSRPSTSCRRSANPDPASMGPGNGFLWPALSYLKVCNRSKCIRKVLLQLTLMTLVKTASILVSPWGKLILYSAKLSLPYASPLHRDFGNMSELSYQNSLSRDISYKMRRGTDTV